MRATGFMSTVVTAIALCVPGIAGAAEPAKDLAVFLSDCPALVVQSLPALAASEVTDICACAGKGMETAAKSLGISAPASAWFDAGKQAMVVCAAPSARRLNIQQCQANKEMRSGVRARTALSDEQYDQYCSCHINLTFDEAARGLDPHDPKSRQIMAEKSAKACLAPIKAGTAPK